MEQPKTTASIIANAESILETARAGLKDLTGGPAERNVPALYNVVVFGRAVTNALQHLRSTEPGFDAWYEPYVKEMENDPLLRFLYKLRSQILKEGSAPSSMRLHITHLSLPQDMAQFGPRPPNAGGFIIGDRYGGTGWEVPLPDGEVAKYYVDLPKEIGSVTFHMRGAPTEHLGKRLPDVRTVTIAKAYITYLDGLVRAAKKRFR